MASDSIPLTVSTILSETASLFGCSRSLSISGISSANLLQTVSARSRKQRLNTGMARALSHLSSSSL